MNKSENSWKSWRPSKVRPNVKGKKLAGTVFRDIPVLFHLIQRLFRRRKRSVWFSNNKEHWHLRQLETKKVQRRIPSEYNTEFVHAPSVFRSLGAHDETKKNRYNFFLALDAEIENRVHAILGRRYPTEGTVIAKDSVRWNWLALRCQSWLRVVIVFVSSSPNTPGRVKKSHSQPR